jgi:arylsulfatase A-like enzyme
MLRRLIDSPWLYFTAAAALLVAAIASQFELQIPSRPKGTVEDIAALAERDDLNVIFILVDTLRADRLGVYGYPRDTSRFMDDLGAHGIVFKHVISQSSWTKSSMASLWTATNPRRNGILRFDHSLPDEAVFPAEIFREAGFQTAGIWRNGWVAPNFGFQQGFDTYVKPVSSPERRRIQRGSPSARGLKGTDLDVTDSAVEFLRNFGSERFFLYMHFMDIHQYIFDDQAPDYGNSYSDAYDKSINWTDRNIGAFLHEVDDMGLLTNSIVVIGSDHGEAFQEHGNEGHARNLYREVAEVPLIIMLPFVLEEGIVVESVVPNIDVWPTLLDLVGMPPLDHVDGVSQLPAILAAGGAKRDQDLEKLERPIFSELDRRWGNGNAEPNPLVSVTDDQLRVFVPMNEPDDTELYDWASDPTEQNDQAAERSEEVATYRGLAERYVADDEPPWGVGAGTVELEEMQLNQLKALGYRIEK